MTGLLTRLLEPMASTPSPTDDYWYAPIGGLSASGINVTADSAMKMSAVFASTRLLSRSVAMLPLGVYAYRSDGGRDQARNHPLFDILHDRPNRWQTSFEWREMTMGHLVLRGNAYSRIVPGPRGPVDQLVPLHPDRMEKVEQLDDGSLRYTYRRQNGMKETFLQDEIFHLRGLSSDGIMGISVIGLARESVGLGLAAESYGARLFSQNATPKVVLEHPGKLAEDAAKRLKASWNDAHSGLANAHSTAVLEEGMKLHQMGLSNEDAQFLQTREFQIEDVARWFGVPLHMISTTTKATSWGTGIEQLSIGFVTYTLLPWLVLWEQAISRDLIIATWTFFAKFLVDALLRGNQRDRYDAYAVGRQWGWLSVNDVRRLEDMNPVPGGDVYMTPLNMAPAGDLPQGAQVRLLATEAAGRVVRKEQQAIRNGAKKHAADSDGWRQWVAEFYGEHADFVAQALCVSPEQARRYAQEQQSELLREGLGIVESWEGRISALAELALGGAT